MSLWSRIANVFRQDRLNRDLDEEMASHIEEAAAAGRASTPAAFGSTLRHREESRDALLVGWLDSLRTDIIFGWRQLLKNKAASGAAILSLALAIGACTAAFRLIDAVLLRPLPVADPQNLYHLAYEYRDDEGTLQTSEIFEYPLFRQMRQVAGQDAELLAISGAPYTEVTFGSAQDMEKAHRQYVSGWMFPSFRLKPALGRLFTEDDDRKPGAHPVAVLSYDYWKRRFGLDPTVLGRTVQISDTAFEIIGVSQEGFSGTETGTVTDIFTPTMMNAKAIDNPSWGWFRIWIRMPPGTNKHSLRDRLQAAFSAQRRERVKTWSEDLRRRRGEEFSSFPLVIAPASAGVSGLQRNYRRSLWILAGIACLVLLIACANVANLMTAQAASRAREMALRVSIGAGRQRLLQLVMVESAIVALVSSAFGALFAWRAAPAVISMIDGPRNPVRLDLPADWRVLGFGILLAAGVTFLFGLAPALRASAVKPMVALRGGADPHARRRLMHALIAAQVAFCFLVHFVAGLFLATFDRLSHNPTGFDTARLLAVEVSAKGGQPWERWAELSQAIRTLPGVESVGQSGWGLMSGNSWSEDIWINGALVDKPEPFFLNVSQDWHAAMGIPIREGTGFRPVDMHPGKVIVNERFARRYFPGQSAVGKVVQCEVRGKRLPLEIAGVSGDALYRNMREPVRPTVYVPLRSQDRKTDGWSTFMVRTSSLSATAAVIRQTVRRDFSAFYIVNIDEQSDIVARHTIRERLLATLSLFFAGTALVLAAVGLYGVLTYSVLQRRRELGIRMALGAPAGNLIRSVTRDVFAMLLAGAVVGLVAGVASERYIGTLLYSVRVTDPSMLVLPVLTIFTAALLASVPPVVRAIRLDPVQTLRAE